MQKASKLKVDIDSLKLWKDNPKVEATSDDIDRLSRKIKRWKLWKPFLVWKSKMVILGGNQRWKACKKLGMRKVWVEYREPKDEAEALEMAITDNEQEVAYDKMKLSELVKIYEEGIDLDEYSIQIKQEKLSNFREQEAEEDDFEFEEDKIKTDIKRGDIFKLGNHRLLCGDATKKEDVEKLMNGKKADMVLTDPPYNVDYGSSKNPRHKIRNLVNDKLDDKGWVNFNIDWITNIIEYYKGGDIYVWGASGPEGMKQRLWLNQMGFHWSATIVWKK